MKTKSNENRSFRVLAIFRVYSHTNVAMPKFSSKLVIPSSLQLSPRASAALDFVRGIAAFFVMIGHLRSLFFVSLKEVEHPHLFVKLFYIITAVQHQAVIVFFVLSGFFISSSIFRMHTQGRWSWKEYLAQRLVRLWIVLIPALFLTAFWDSLGIHLFGNSIYLGMPSDKYILQFSVLDRLNFPTFVSNLFFLQGIVSTPFGSNVPLWSLSYEFWYYIAFPCALTILISPSKKIKILNGFFLVALGFFVGKEITLSFAIWLLGVIVIFFPYLWHKHQPLKLYTLGMAIIPFSLSIVLSIAQRRYDLSWVIALAFAVLMYIIFRLESDDQESSVASVATKFSKTIAGFSYSLYLLHLSPLIFLHAYLNSINPAKWQPTPLNIALGVLIAICATAYAWVISLFTEAKTAQFRRFIKQKFNV